MQRIFIGAGLLLLACSLAFGQDAQPGDETPPPRDPRVDQLLPQVDQLTKDAAQLRRTIADQERRIAELERTVKALQTTAAPKSKCVPSQNPDWHVAGNWACIRKGMSEAQVKELLGPATRVISVIDMRTLYYQPDAKTLSPINGRVTLLDDRVTAFVTPEF